MTLDKPRLTRRSSSRQHPTVTNLLAGYTPRPGNLLWRTRRPEPQNVRLGATQGPQVSVISSLHARNELMMVLPSR